MKKGELLTSQIIGFILLAVAFIIVLWVYSSIAFPAQIDSTTCHESVVLRATFNSVGGGTVGGLAPLQCKTRKICLGGNCKAFEGAKNVLNIKAKKIEDKKDIEKVIAQEMVNCWTMMGEGKASVFSPDLYKQMQFGSIASTCVICSRIAISDNVDKNIENAVNPMDYMFRHKVPGLEVSYYEFFSGDSSGATVQEEVMKDNPAGENAPEVAIIFMQAETGNEGWGLIKNDVIAGLGIGFASKQVGISFLARKAVVAVGSKVAAVATIIGIGIVAGVQTYNVYNNREIVAGYCGDISLGEKQGCSVVRAIPYNKENLKHYCGYIDSIA